MRPVRGFTLGVVLMLIAVCMVSAFMVAGTSLFHLSTSQAVYNTMRARNLADRVVAEAAAAVEAAANQGTLEKFGTRGETWQLVPPAVPDGCLAYLSFVPGNFPYSLNNPDPTVSAVGSLSQKVPPACIDLIGTGRSGAATIQVEAILHLPPFAYVMASSGTFTSPKGGLVVAEVDALSLLANGFSNVSPADVLPGSMASNSGLGPAVQIGPSSLVTGNVSADGTIQLDAGGTAVVKGALLPGSQPVALPTVDVNTDPGQNVPGEQIISKLPAGGTLSGFARANQSVQVPGDLSLDGAVLYVKGNITVTGVLKGTGAVIATGAITLQGGADVQSDDIVALLAGGDVTLTGGAKTNNIFQGMVYTGGNLVANNLQLYGQFVANGTVGPGDVTLGGPGNMVMNNCTVVGVPELQNLTLTTSSSSGGSSSQSFGVTLGSGQVGSFGSGKVLCGDTSCGSDTIGLSYDGGTHMLTVTDANSGESTSVPAYSPGQDVFNEVVSAIAQMYTTNCGSDFFGAPSLDSQTGQELMAQITAAMGAGGGVGSQPLQRQIPGQQTSGKVVWEFDMNKFMAPADQVRLLLWRQL